MLRTVSPYTEQIFADMAGFGNEPHEHQVVALESDRNATDGALRSAVSKKKRLGLSSEQVQTKARRQAVVSARRSKDIPLY